MESKLEITRAKDYGWRYIVKGNIVGFKVDFEYVDEANFDATMSSLARMVEAHVESNKSKA